MLSSTMKSLFFKSLRSKQIAIFVVVATIFVTVISLALYEGNKKTVTLGSEWRDGKKLRHMHIQLVNFFLSRKLEVSEHDIVTPSMNTPVENGLSIRWEQAEKVAIEIDNQEDVFIWTTKKTVGDVLDEAGIELTEYDKVSPSLEAKLNDNNSISVEKAYEFTLIDGRDKREVTGQLRLRSLTF